jgi:hypothetical protein
VKMQASSFRKAYGPLLAADVQPQQTRKVRHPSNETRLAFAAWVAILQNSSWGWLIDLRSTDPASRLWDVKVVGWLVVLKVELPLKQELTPSFADCDVQRGELASNMTMVLFISAIITTEETDSTDDCVELTSAARYVRYSRCLR